MNRLGFFVARRAQFLSSLASGVFMSMIVTTLLGHYLMKWIPYTAIQDIMILWPYICFIYITTQLPVLAIQYLVPAAATSDNDTSWFPLVGLLFALAVLYVKGISMGVEGMHISGWSLITSIIDVCLMWAGNYMRR